MMMNRSLLPLFALSMSMLSTSSLNGPELRRLEFELAEYNSHRHWEDGPEKNVYPMPTVAPTQAPGNFLPVEGDDEEFGPDSTDDATDDSILDPSESDSKGGGIGAMTTILISAGGVVVVAAALYLRRKTSEDQEGATSTENDTSAAPAESIPSTAADV